MGVLIIRKPATSTQITEMCEELDDVIKLQSPVLRQRFEAIVRYLLEIV